MTHEEIKQAAHNYAEINDWCLSAEVIKSAFIAGAEANVPKWTLCSDKMPAELVAVIVFIPDQDYVGSAVWEKSEGWYENFEGELIDSEVTHWMPLPSPPNTQP